VADWTGLRNICIDLILRVCLSSGNSISWPILSEPERTVPVSTCGAKTGRHRGGGGARGAPSPPPDRLHLGCISATSRRPVPLDRLHLGYISATSRRPVPLDRLHLGYISPSRAP